MQFSKLPKAFFLEKLTSPLSPPGLKPGELLPRGGSDRKVGGAGTHFQHQWWCHGEHTGEMRKAGGPLVRLSQGENIQQYSIGVGSSPEGPEGIGQAERATQVTLPVNYLPIFFGNTNLPGNKERKNDLSHWLPFSPS